MTTPRIPRILRLIAWGLYWDVQQVARINTQLTICERLHPFRDSLCNAKSTNEVAGVLYPFMTRNMFFSVKSCRVARCKKMNCLEPHCWPTMRELFAQFSQEERRKATAFQIIIDPNDRDHPIVAIKEGDRVVGYSIMITLFTAERQAPVPAAPPTIPESQPGASLRNRPRPLFGRPPIFVRPSWPRGTRFHKGR